VPVGLQVCNGKAINQRFKLEKKRGDYIQIQSAHSGKCLGIADASKKRGAAIQQWSCLGYDNQLWKKIDHTRHMFALKAKHSGLCLTAIRIKKKKNTKLQQLKCTGATSIRQLFKLNQ
jgi:hypothetical protein